MSTQASNALWVGICIIASAAGGFWQWVESRRSARKKVTSKRR